MASFKDGILKISCTCFNYKSIFDIAGEQMLKKKYASIQFLMKKITLLKIQRKDLIWQSVLIVMSFLRSLKDPPRKPQKPRRPTINKELRWWRNKMISSLKWVVTFLQLEATSMQLPLSMPWRKARLRTHFHPSKWKPETMKSFMWYHRMTQFRYFMKFILQIKWIEHLAT